jgi:hypothetical protein
MHDYAAIKCGPCCASLLTARPDRYEKPEVYGIVEIPVPTLRENDVLVCALCDEPRHYVILFSGFVPRSQSKMANEYFDR